MKALYVTGISNEKEVTDFFMVKSIGLKLGANKKQYLDISLGDKTGEISGKKWDVTDEELMELQTINEGDLVTVSYTHLDVYKRQGADYQFAQRTAGFLRADLPVYFP